MNKKFLKELKTQLRPSKLEKLSSKQLSNKITINDGLIIKGLQDSNAIVRQSAAALSGQIKSAMVLPELYGSLNDQSKVVRKNAFSAINEIEGHFGIKPINAVAYPTRQRLEGLVNNGRLATGMTFKNAIPTKKPIHLLGGLLNTVDPNLKMEAASSFLQVGSIQPKDLGEGLSTIEPKQFVKAILFLSGFLGELEERKVRGRYVLYHPAFNTSYEPEILPELFNAISKRLPLAKLRQPFMQRELHHSQRKLLANISDPQNKELIRKAFLTLELPSISKKSARKKSPPKPQKMLYRRASKGSQGPSTSAGSEPKKEYTGGGIGTGTGGTPGTGGSVPPIKPKSREPVKKGDRYTDYIFKEQPNGTQLQNGEVLVKGKRYQLGARVTTDPKGIPIKEGERAPIHEPRIKKTHSLYVTLESPDFRIQSNIKTVKLPSVGNSSMAYFTLRSEDFSRSEEDLKKLKIRWYYSFNLIQVDEIECEVVESEEEGIQSQFGLERPVSLSQKRLEIRFEELDSTQTSHLQIEIDKKNGNYQLAILARNSQNGRVNFVLPLSKSSSELDNMLSGVRKTLHQCCTDSKYKTCLAGSKLSQKKMHSKLATEGKQLWNTLFRSNREDAIYAVGKWLEDHPLAPDSIIQISTSREAADLLIPWSLLYQGELASDGSIDLESFWGYRYRIQQNHYSFQSKEEQPKDQREVGFYLWDRFQNAEEHKQLFERVDPGKDKFKEVHLLLEKNEGLIYLKNSHPDILYFYTHGHTRYNNEALFLKYIKYLEENSQLSEKAKFDDDKSWIELTRGIITLGLDLYEIEELKSSPMVFLNMCESAQIYPSMSSNFVDFFLNRGSRCVIGTECEMTALFAAAFSEHLFDQLMDGKELGDAFLATRRHFLHEYRNPLGLAYTCYGDLTFKI